MLFAHDLTCYDHHISCPNFFGVDVSSVVPFPGTSYFDDGAYFAETVINIHINIWECPFNSF